MERKCEDSDTATPNESVCPVNRLLMYPISSPIFSNSSGIAKVPCSRSSPPGTR